MTHWLDSREAVELVASGTNAFRLAWGIDCQVERFGTSVLISARCAGKIEQLARELEVWCTGGAWNPARVYQRLLVQDPQDEDKPSLLSGNASPDRREVVLESGLAFEVDFAASYSPGLFCDQRGNRNILRHLRPTRVLNAFAYTCAFSVAAAAIGAQTVSIDISRSSLTRGRRNFALNGLNLEGHRFMPEDTLTYLTRLARRGEKFDMIILDPPTFGRGGGKRVFRIERDFSSLVLAALAVAAKGARILLSTNFHQWGPRILREQALETLPKGTLVEVSSSGSDDLAGATMASIWAGPLL